MKKFLILILGLSLTAASCNFITDPITGTSGARGVFVSEDAGESFHASNKLSKGDIDNVSVNMLMFDPANPDIIYLASSNGMYKSENGGDSWKYILTGIAVGDLTIDPFDSKIIYASGLSGPNGKIIKSMDAGTTWVDLYNEPTRENAVLTITLSSANSQVLLAGMNNGEIIRSSDSGQTWQTSKDIDDRILRIRFAHNAAYALTLHEGVFKSVDQGVTWQDISSPITGDVFSSQPNAVASISLFHDLALDMRQSGVLYLGSEEGLLRTVNDGQNWNFVNLPVRDAAIKVTAVAVNPANSNNLLVSIGSTIFKSMNGGVTWETKRIASAQTMRTILINPTSSNLIYVGLGNKK